MNTEGIIKRENLIIFLLLAFLFLIIIIFLNPDEQLRKTRDSSREVYATELLRAMTRYHVSEKEPPAITPISSTMSCTDIVSGSPVSDIASLSSDLADWFPERIKQPQNLLYVGIATDGEKRVCYKIESKRKVSEVPTRGCTLNKDHFLCVSEK